MLQLYIACTGWSYDGWIGHFYPRKLDKKDWLEYYSKVFDFVEIDSSFYNIPDELTTGHWAKVTPDNFKFTAKFPQAITHQRRLGRGIESDLEYFYRSMTKLENKLLCLVLQLPPSLSKDEGLKKLQAFPFDKRFRYAVEPRHKTWFVDEVYSFFMDNNLCLAWSQLADLQTPPVVTTDFIYLRLIGDRSIPEERFGTVQKDRSKEIAEWAKTVRKFEKAVKMAIVVNNNHYAGFGPASSNTFRRELGMTEGVYEEMKQSTFKF